MDTNRSLIIVGGGLVGLATAYQSICMQPGLPVTLLEKDARVANQQSTHNSGVLHAGLYYKPGSEKARLSVDGLRMMTAFCREFGVPHQICGKIVVATEEAELPRLDDLLKRGQLNGLHGLRRLRREEIREIEPHASGIAAVHVPQEGIVDYRAVADRMAEQILKRGGVIHLNARVNRLRRERGSWVVETNNQQYTATNVVNCGGLHSDRLVRMAGARPSAKIVPFRGEYFELKPARQHLVRNLIYPVPDPKFPFLGVHFTRMMTGGVEAGPNAVLAFEREGYRKFDIKVRDLLESLTYPGLWRFLIKYPSMASYELYRSFSKAAFCRSLQRLIPEIQENDLAPGGSGVRAQAMYRDGRLVEDFHFEESEGILHVVNAPSPAATASLAIGQSILRRLQAQL